MKKISFILSLCLFSAFAIAGGGTTKPKKVEGHSLKFKINGIKDTVIFLANYYGEKQYYKDTATVDGMGNFTFEGKQPLPGGIYSVVMPNKKSYFEFIVNEQEFYMETTKDKLVPDMKVKGSVENDVFYKYLQYINVKGAEAQPLRDQLGKLDEKSEEAKQTREKLNKIDTEVKNYKLEVIKNNPTLFVSKVFTSSQDPEVPEAPTLANGRKDSTFAYRYFKKHYFDNIDFSDERLIRTPIFHNKVSYFMSKLVPQIPDSINKDADYVANKAKANKELFKYVVHYITNTYEKSKIMGMDAVFVHMGLTYYKTGQAFWTDSAQNAKIVERATTLAPLLVGKKTPNIILQDTTESNWVNLYTDIKTKYTVLFFWDPGCGHCKKSMPKMKEVYDKFKNQGVEVFSVCTEFETKDWKKFINEHSLTWVNVSDNPEINKNAAKYLGKFTTLESLNFRTTYDIFATPQIYLLDENKVILAKKLGPEQLEEILDNKINGKKMTNAVMSVEENH